MSSTPAPPPIRRPGNNDSHSPTARRAGRRRRWPVWTMAAVSAGGVMGAIVALSTILTPARIAIATTGFLLVIVVGTVMLFVQRVLDVGVARTAGTPLVSSFELGDKIAFGLMLIASFSNGLVIALQIARQ